MKSIKPLGRPSYGSIGHLPTSRMGLGDHHITEGQAAIATIKTRDRNDFVVVQEKLDGSNVGVARINGETVPLIRAGYRALESNFEQHRHFHNWVMQNLSRFEWLDDGERVCGEWLMQAHGTRYQLKHEPFVMFDIMRGDKRLTYEAVSERSLVMDLPMPRLLSIGGACSVDRALHELGEFGHHGALDLVEGAVWRVERNGEVDFLAKWVRPDKQDGKYLESVTGNGPVWNYVPEWMVNNAPR